MMPNGQPKSAEVVTHRNLGHVEIDEACLALQATNPDSTSMFVKHDGDIKEVTRALVSMAQQSLHLRLHRKTAMSRLSALQKELLDAMLSGVSVHMMKGIDTYYFRSDNHAKCTKSVNALLSKGLVEKFAEDWRGAKVRPIQSIQN